MIVEAKIKSRDLGEETGRHSYMIHEHSISNQISFEIDNLNSSQNYGCYTAHLSEVYCRPLSFFARPLKIPQVLRPQPSNRTRRPGPEPARGTHLGPGAVRSGHDSAGVRTAVDG
jgi:hypothetical protein